ncbi:MAG: hypothetical protein AAB903_02935, partial [Patescibacteria group bacterium]
MITLAIAHALAVRFRHGEREEALSVTVNGNVRVSGRYNQGSIQMSFYSDSLGVCDLSSRPRHRPISLVEKILRSLTEEELFFGRLEKPIACFGKGEILLLGPEEDVRASCLVYAAVLKHSRKRIANGVARRVSEDYPCIAQLIGLHISDIKRLYDKHSIRG